VQRIAREVHGPTIAGLARAVEADIEQCWEAIKDAQRPRIHTFLSPAMSTSNQAWSATPRAVARRLWSAWPKGTHQTWEFSPMDATRSDWAFVSELLEAVVEAGATTVNIPDTCGFVQPDELGAMIAYLREHVANIDRATISVHCHDDLGLAVANSLAAIKAGRAAG